MKQPKLCYTCQKLTYNLMNAACNHKICYQCVKNNRSSKCINCQKLTKSKIIGSLSPSRNLSQQRQKQKSTNFKDSDNKSKSFLDLTPMRNRTSRKSLSKSPLSYDHSPEFQQQIPSQLSCKTHSEPLSMYSKSTKQIMCPSCLCKKSKHSDILPLKNAQEYLRKENKIFKEENKIVLNNIQHAQKTVKKNVEIFRSCFESNLEVMEGIFEGIYKDLEIIEKRAKQQYLEFFDKKFKQCDQINQDLIYLTSILKDLKQSQKENTSLTEQVYLFTSYKVIKETLRNLNFDYFPYTKEPNIIEFNKFMITDAFENFLKVKLDLPLKYNEMKRNKSRQNKSISRSKYDQDESTRYNKSKSRDRNSTTKKHQMSLCNNSYGVDFGEEDKNYYKMLLKNKFKL